MPGDYFVCDRFPDDPPLVFIAGSIWKDWVDPKRRWDQPCLFLLGEVCCVVRNHSSVAVSTSAERGDDGKHVLCDFFSQLVEATICRFSFDAGENLNGELGTHLLEGCLLNAWDDVVRGDN